LLSSHLLLQTRGLHVNLRAKASPRGLKIVRITDSPWNDTQQKPHTFEDVHCVHASAVVIEGGEVLNGRG